MFDRRTADLLRRLGSCPGDDPAWIELARRAERRQRAPRAGVAPPVEGLWEAWRRHPHERSLGWLLCELLGLEVLEGPAQPGGPGMQGAPRRVRHPATGIELVWLTRGAYFARFPVTVRAYQRFLEATHHRAPVDDLKRQPWPLQRDQPTRPVVFVSYEDAEAFCRWAGGRLPGGAEWTAAAGPGPFPWGGAAPDRQRATYNPSVPWRGGDWTRFLVPVGSTPAGASAEGVEDLAGNVREWTAEPVRLREEEAVLVTSLGGRRPLGKRWVRGGAWSSSAVLELQSSSKGLPLDRSARRDDVGFRLVLGPTSLQAEPEVPEVPEAPEAPEDDAGAALLAQAQQALDAGDDPGRGLGDEAVRVDLAPDAAEDLEGRGAVVVDR